MKFLCDQMLIRVGKWLRAAGYDTLIIEEPIEDTKIFSLAEKEDRKLLTRDRHFLEMADSENRIIWLESNELDDCIRELSGKIPVNWVLAPFSRCILCNTEFAEPTPEDLDQVPQDVLEYADRFSKCPKCQKVFWLGSHTDHMLDQLKRWSNLLL